MNIKIEFILKASTIMDIAGPWVDSGHVDNTKDGRFVFEDVKSYNYVSDKIDIHTDDATYLFNVSDFYRIKITRGE
jgi:hypothetical protein